MTRPPAAGGTWQALRALTPARIALGRSGVSLPTAAVLEFGLAQARARDAVYAALDLPALHGELDRLGHAALDVHSAAVERGSYLLRPDLGRRLDAASRARLEVARAAQAAAELVLVLADGLSATAVMRHAPPLLAALAPWLPGRQPVTVVIASQARVALGDEVGELLGARQVAVLIGERPGLSAHDSLGVYLTHAPRLGRTDAERNCVSNIGGGGLGYQQAARRLTGLLDGARRLGRTGVDLKDDSDTQLGSPPSGDDSGAE